MTTWGVPDSSITYNSHDISDEITTELPVLDEANETEDITGVSMSIAQQAFTGLTTYGEFPVGGPMSDTVNGAYAVLRAAATAKSYATLVLDWGGVTTTITNVGVKNFKRTIAKGALNGFSATLFLGPGAGVNEA